MPEFKKLALLIGVSEYGEGLEPLSAPPKDVVAVERVLADPNLGGFDPDNITTLINPNLAEMREKIEDLFAQSSRWDLVLLYFSGHGVTDDNNRLYLTTRNTSKNRYRSRSVPASFIQDLSDDTYAKRQVIILDCCYSGAFAEGWQRKGDIRVDLERELGKEGRVVLTSSSSTQVSFQQEDADLSLYTQYFLEGIESGVADKNQDGMVTVRELHSYARKKVQEVKPKMKPDIIVADDEGYDILLSRVKVDAESQFRKLVERYIDHERGEIRSHRSQAILDKRAQDLDIAVEQSQAIIDSVLEPTRRRLKHLEEYRQEYATEVEKQYPLSEAVLAELREWQQEVLGLEDGDVTAIQAEVNAIKKRQIAEGLQKQLESQHVETERQQPINIEFPLSQQAFFGFRNFEKHLGIKEDDTIATQKQLLRALEEAKYHHNLKVKGESENKRQHASAEQRIDSLNYYDILSISQSADEDTIKRSFRKLARKYHPDVNPGNKEAAEIFVKISKAVDVLSDPDKRKKYDELVVRQRIDSLNYYDILSISQSADEDTIKRSFRKLARKYHPDVNPGNKEAAEIFVKISKAVDVLSDPDKRKKHDELIRNNFI